MLYASYGLVIIGQINKKLQIIISTASICVSLYIYKLFTIDAIHFYNLENNTNSTRLYSFIGDYLPSWLEAKKVIYHSPNIVFLLFSILLIYSGFIFNSKYKKEY